MYTPIKKLQEYFSNGKRPNGQQFSELITSLWHKSEKLSIEDVRGLREALKGFTGVDDEELQKLLKEIAEARVTAENAMNEVAGYNARFASIEKQIDGKVSNWFYKYSPTLLNFPASSWTTNGEKEKHIGDTFTNVDEGGDEVGVSWRFVEIEGIYKWLKISDSNAAKALQKAAKALAAVDGKSTTYLERPSSYELGDSWILDKQYTLNGVTYEAGEILTALQDSADFNESHWVKRVPYATSKDVDAIVADSIALLNKKFAAIEKQIDGKVSNWFYKYSPTSLNLPASEWTTSEEKEKHVGDTFTNVDEGSDEAGVSWRFVKISDNYKWLKISDNDAVKALQKAAKALAVADGKSTTYLARPSSYEYGDSWILDKQYTLGGVTYETGEILTALQDSSDFNESHWVKRVPYASSVEISQKLEALKQATQKAWEQYIAAKDFLTKTVHDADLDGVRDTAEKKAIAEARAAMLAAQKFAKTKKAEAIAAAELYARTIKEEILKKQAALDKSVTDLKKKVDDFDVAFDEISGDGLISKMEKIAVEKYKNSIEESTKRASGAFNKVFNSGYVTGSVKAALDAAYKSLSTQKAHLLAVINAVIKDDKVTDTEKNNVDASFYNYNAAFVQFEKALKDAEHAQVYAVEARAKEQIENLRADSNLLDGSSFANHYSYLRSEGSYNSESGARTVNKKGDLGDGAIYRDFEIDKKYVGKELTFSVEVSATWAINYFLVARSIDENGELLESNTSDVFLAENPTVGQLSCLTFIPSTAKIRLYLYTKSSINLSLLGGFMLTEGVKAVRWQPSLHDLDSARDKKIKESEAKIKAQIAAAKLALERNISTLTSKTDFLRETSVLGAALATGALLVGNENGANAGVSGTDTGDNAIRFYAGSAHGKRKEAPYRVTDSGALYAKKAHIEGHIVAKSGSFSGYMSAPFLVLEGVYNNMELDLTNNLNIILDVSTDLNVNLPTHRKYNGATSVILHNSIARTPVEVTVNNTHSVNYAVLMFLAVPTEGSEVTWVKVYEQHLPPFNAR